MNVSKSVDAIEMNSEDTEDFIVDMDDEGMVYVNDTKAVRTSSDF